MKGSPAPYDTRAPHPAIVCPDPMSTGIRTPSVGHIAGNPHIRVRWIIDPYSMRGKRIIKIRNIRTWRDIIVRWFVIFLPRRWTLFLLIRHIDKTAGSKN